MTDEHGLFEHALFSRPRVEHGYCVDDVARGLVLTCRETRPDRVAARLREEYLAFVLEALDNRGRCHNRMNRHGRWTDGAGVGDWWGRAVWGLGTASSHTLQAHSAFHLAAQERSPFARSMGFAALGAVEVLRTWPDDAIALELLTDAVTALDPPDALTDAEWPWPEPRLRYANAVVPEVLIGAGAALHDPALGARGLELLDFLIRVETPDGHLSVTPVGGRGPGETGPRFDQQPIEVAALADACATAHRVTGDERWPAEIARCLAWFEGVNDSATPMWDQRTGAGFDGLQVSGRNSNEGAESTLAALTTVQHAHRC